MKNQCLSSFMACLLRWKFHSKFFPSHGHKMPSQGSLGSSSVLYHCYYLFAQKYQSKPSILEPHSYPSTWLLWIWNPPRIWSWDSGEIISHKLAIIFQSKCADTEDYLRVRRSSSKRGFCASWCLPMWPSQCCKGLYDTASGFPQSRKIKTTLQYLSNTKVTHQLKVHAVNLVTCPQSLELKY